MFLTAAKWTWVFPPTGWTWANTISVGAGVLSLLALILSWLAFRQRIRYHPQPKFVADWYDTTLGPHDSGHPVLRGVMFHNFGDAPAMDVQVFSNTTEHLKEMVPVYSAAQIDPGPGGFGPFWIPLTRDLKMGLNRWNAKVPVLSVPDGEARWERPVVTLRWRQAPFSKPPRRLKTVAPKNPKHMPVYVPPPASGTGA